MCHIVLIGLPLLALSTFWLLPLTLALPTFVVLIAATIWFYAFLMKGARRPVITGREALQHAIAEVYSVRSAGITIRVHSELWSAQAREELHVGDQVEVVGVDGLLLHVRKVNSSEKKVPST